MALENTAWKMRAAIETLATSTGTLQERLADVYRSHLMPLDHMGHEWDFPPELRAEVAHIQESMTSAPTRGQGTLQATVDSMADEEAVRIAEAIVALNYHVWEALNELGDIRFPKDSSDS
jgi:hypothetical protein